MGNFTTIFHYFNFMYVYVSVWVCVYEYCEQEAKRVGSLGIEVPFSGKSLDLSIGNSTLVIFK